MDKNILENHQRYLERVALDKSYGYDIDRERNFIVEQAKPLDGRILEAGTGRGHFALALAKEGHQFVTFDISADEQSYAKLNLAYYSLDKLADFRIENAEHTGFPGGSFDIIFSVNLIHHLKNPYVVVEELVRVLSPKGKLVVADFTEDGFEIVDKIHALDGDTHERGKVTILDIELYLINNGFLVKHVSSEIQHVLVARRSLS